MEFNEKTARKIIDINNLANGTLRTWKDRGIIPDLYFNRDGKIRVTKSLKKGIYDLESQIPQKIFADKGIKNFLEAVKKEKGINSFKELIGDIVYAKNPLSAEEEARILMLRLKEDGKLIPATYKIFKKDVKAVSDIAQREWRDTMTQFSIIIYAWALQNGYQHV